MSPVEFSPQSANVTDFEQSGAARAMDADIGLATATMSAKAATLDNGIIGLPGFMLSAGPSSAHGLLLAERPAVDANQWGKCWAAIKDDLQLRYKLKCPLCQTALQSGGSPGLVRLRLWRLFGEPRLVRRYPSAPRRAERDRRGRGRVAVMVRLSRRRRRADVSRRRLLTPT